MHPDVRRRLDDLLADQVGLDAADAATVAAVVELLATEPGELPSPARTDLVTTTAKALTVLDGAYTELLGSWDLWVDWSADAARSGASWLAARTEMSRPAAASRLRVARLLALHAPVAAAALRAGRIGLDKARALMSVRTPATAVLFSDHVHYLVDTIEGLTVADARVFLERWLMMADPDHGR